MNVKLSLRALAFLLVIAPAIARADEPASAPYAEHPQKTWYGWQILLIDGGATLTGIAAATSSNSTAGGALGVVALAAYMLGGPIVHWSHGNVGRGFASLGLRVALPTVGLVAAGVGAKNDPGNGDGLAPGAAVGLLVVLPAGIIAASAIDTSALAYEAPRPPPPTQPLALPALPQEWTVPLLRTTF
jgi:hypothetical protein